MSFGAPYCLWALVLLPALVFLFLGNERRRRTLLKKIVAARLLPQLAGSSSPGRRRLRFAMLLLGIAAVIVSLAQPQYGYTWEQSKRSGRDVFIAIDTSKSMLSTDVAPDRLSRAKLAAQDLIMQLQGDRVGVLAFAGEAFLQTPLTIDYNAALDSITDLDTNTIPRGGTDIASVIDEAARAFGKGESEDRALILFTDGEELDADGVAAARAQAGNFRIFTVGVGTAEGSLIPVPNSDGGTDFVKDEYGQIVKSKLDEGRLQEIATATNGFYTHLQNGPEEMKKIVQEGLGKMHEHDIDARMSRHPIERYQWPLALGLALMFGSMFISERRREPSNGKRRAALQTALVLLAVLCGAHSARAALPANQGIELYNDKKYKESYDSFNGQLLKSPDSQALEFDSGAAAYKTGDYDKAIEAFGKATTSSNPAVSEKAEYNLGNALCLRGAKQEEKEMKLKDWNNAIQHYEEALKINPNNGDAKYNRDAVKKLIEQLNQKPPPQPKQDNKDQQKKQDQKDQKDQKNDQQNQQNQKNDQQKNQQDQQKNDQNSGGGKDQQQDKQNSGEKNQENPKDDGNSQKSQSNQQQQQQPQNQQGQGSQQNPQQGQQPGQKQDSKPDDNQQQPSPGQNQQPGQPGSQPQNANGSQGDQSQAPQSTPSPSPSDQPGQNSPGKIQAQQSGTNSGNSGQEEAYVPGQERQMTPTEAGRVVEAEKDEEAKGVLNEHKTSAPVLKDW